MVAVDTLYRASVNLKEVARLPKEVGDRVKWPHNGLIWVRTGPNSWETEGLPNAVDSRGRRRWWPSDHVADHDFEVLP